MPDRQHYALIVIGAGMSGLSAGLTWALNNNLQKKPVLLLEKEPMTGGYVTTYTRRGYRFDTCQMISNLSRVFDYFGLDVEFKEFQGNFGRVVLVEPEKKLTRTIDLPAGEQRFKQRIMQLYPEDAKAFGKFFDYSQAMFHEINKLKYAPTPWELLKTAVTCPKIVRNADKTLLQYMQPFGMKHPDILEIMRLFTVMAGMPEDQVAAFLPLGVMFSLLERAFRPRDYFIDLPRKMEKRFLDLGGHLQLKSPVRRILTAQGKAVGVELHDGKQIIADHVITTLDVKLLPAMLGEGVLEQTDARFAEKVKTVPMSPSTLNVNLGLDDDLDLQHRGFDCGYTMLTTGGTTLQKLFAAAAGGRSAYSKNCFHVGVICPSLTTGGKTTLNLSCFPMALGQWKAWRAEDQVKYRQEKEKWATFLINLVETYLIPNLSKHISVMDVSTPATYARYSESPSGSIYDMTSNPDNFGLKRLRTDTPVKNLYQPKFAHGVFGTINGGMQAVDMIMKRKIMHGNSRFA